MPSQANEQKNSEAERGSNFPQQASSSNERPVETVDQSTSDLNQNEQVQASTSNEKVPRELTFPGKIFLVMDTGLQFARDEYSNPTDANTANRMIYWADGSTQDGFKGISGSGIVYKRDENSWADSSWQISAEVNIHVAELAAICKALEFANQNLHRIQRTPLVVVIYTDSQTALIQLRDSKFSGILTNFFQPGLTASHELRQRGFLLELRWMKGHRGVEGHGRAHKAARRGRLSRETNTQNNAPFFEVGRDGDESERPPIFLTN